MSEKPRCRAAVLVFMDPADTDKLRMPDNSWHLSAMTTVAGIESGQVAKEFAGVLPGVTVSRKSQGKNL